MNKLLQDYNTLNCLALLSNFLEVQNNINPRNVCYSVRRYVISRNVVQHNSGCSELTMDMLEDELLNLAKNAKL